MVSVRAHGRLQQIPEGSTEHSNEHREASNAVVPHTNISTEENPQNVSQIHPSNNLLVARDGTEWTPVVSRANSRGRRSQQNILRECPGPTAYARRNVNTNSPASAWRLI